MARVFVAADRELVCVPVPPRAFSILFASPLRCVAPSASPTGHAVLESCALREEQDKNLNHKHPEGASIHAPHTHIGHEKQLQAMVQMKAELEALRANSSQPAGPPTQLAEPAGPSVSEMGR